METFNLKTATAQAVFDRSAGHLLKQNCKSEGDGECLYRGPNGRMCAAGPFIPDDEYNEGEFEGKSWETLVIDYPAEFENDHNELILKLQDVHDSLEPESWPQALRQLAIKNGLAYIFDRK